MKYKIGDIVDFIGTRYYTRPNGKVFFSAKPGIARIDAIMENEVPHPYHLIAEPNGGTTIKGWVTESDFKIRPKESELKVVSLANSPIVKIAYAKNLEDGIDIVSSKWEDQKWTAVFRPKNIEDAEKIAHMAEVACAKGHFSDMQAYATTFVEICFNSANPPTDHNVNKTMLIRSGLYFNFDSDFYLKDDQYLRRGDILLGDSGSAIVLSSGKNSSKQMATSKPNQQISTGEPTPAKRVAAKPVDEETKIVTAKEKPEEQNHDLAGMYKGITPIFIKDGAGASYYTLAKLPLGSIVRNYGYYTVENSIKWLYVQAKYKDVIYNGFVSEKCVAKQ